jgi:hypothetical protein
MAADCGANKEAVMLPNISGFSGISDKKNGGVAGLPQPPSGTVLAFYFLGPGVIPAGSLK